MKKKSTVEPFTLIPKAWMKPKREVSDMAAAFSYGMETLTNFMPTVKGKLSTSPSQDTSSTATDEAGDTLTVGMMQRAVELMERATERAIEDNFLTNRPWSYGQENHMTALQLEAIRYEQERMAYARYETQAMDNVQFDEQDHGIILSYAGQYYAIPRRHFELESPERQMAWIIAGKKRVIRMAWERNGQGSSIWGGAGGLNIMAGSLNYIRDHAVMHGAGGAVERPVKEERYASIAKAVVESGGFRAELLDSNWKLWDESDTMRNCVYRSYRGKVQEGSYRLYHVSGVKGFSNGVTVGYHATRDERRDDMLDEYVVTETWTVDQIKGKANSACTDRALQEFCDKVGDGMKVERRDKRVVMEREMLPLPIRRRTLWDMGW